MNMKFDYPFKTRDDFLKDVVILLVKRRHDLGITQEELNHSLGVADRLISKWECGIRTPTSFHLYCWADALQSKLTVIPTGGDTLDLANKLQKHVANDNRPIIDFEELKTGTR